VADRDSKRRAQLSDIIIIAPTNEQVWEIQQEHSRCACRHRRLTNFQGQEAAIAIYSLASVIPRRCARAESNSLQCQSPERFAMSRAKSLAIMVAVSSYFRRPNAKHNADALRMSSADMNCADDHSAVGITRICLPSSPPLN